MFDVVRAPLAERLVRVGETVATACQRSGRDPAGIALVAITKGQPVTILRMALEAGLEDIGENRVQDARIKFEAVRRELAHARRHMVGHLQRNKVRDALELFDWIQSVDSLRLAREISARSEARATPVEILIQVNASGEDRKQGFAPAEADEIAAEIAAMPGLRLRGVMTMAPWTDEEAVLRRTFRTARRVFEDIAGRHDPRLDTLSMGMSNDYTVAIEEGATMIRLGTALFGPREGAR